MAGYAEIDIRGQRHTGNIDSTTKVRDVTPKMTLLNPYRTPFVTLLNELGSKPTVAEKYEFYEDDFILPTAKVGAGGQLIGDTTFQLATGEAARLNLESQLRNPATNEIMRITSVNTATDQIVVTRNFGDLPLGAAAIAANQVLIIASEAREEGIKLASAITTNPTNFFNLVEDFETAVEASWRNMGTKDYMAADFDYQTVKSAEQHKEKIEAAMWWGARASVAAGLTEGKKVTYTGGVEWFIRAFSPAANIVTVSSVLTDTALEDWLEIIFRNGNPDRKMIFTSPFGRMMLGRLAKTTLRTDANRKTLGINITKLEVLGMEVPVATSLLFANVGYNAYMFCLDMDYINFRNLSANGLSFTTKWLRNVQDPDRKGRKDVLHSTLGLEMKNEKAHGILSGFVG